MGAAPAAYLPRQRAMTAFVSEVDPQDSTSCARNRIPGDMSWRNSAVRRPLPSGFIAPCLPTLSQSVPSGPRWVHEIKHDGFRLICRREGERVRIFTRRGNDWTDRVPAIVQAVRSLRAATATLDGEAVICDERGISDFDALRSALARRAGSRSMAVICAIAHGRAVARH